MHNAAEVRAQLERVSASASFRASQRCQRLLRRVVEQSLEPNAEPLKERVLGVEVFGREPTYDTASDPIVRVTAGDIRRRLGQYYADPAHQQELRIDLPAGHYVPVFSWPAATTAASAAGAMAAAPVAAITQVAAMTQVAASSPVEGAEATATPAPATDDARQRGRTARIASFASVAIAASILLLGIITSTREPTPSAQFWDPLLRNGQPVLVCTGSIDITHVSGRIWQAAYAPDQAEASRNSTDTPHPLGTAFVTVTDAVALARMVSLFHEREKPYRIRTDQSTSFGDLRASPTVLVGAFNNTWTLRLSSDFRYVPEKDSATGAFVIRDRQNPAVEWHPDYPWPDPRVSHDYGFVSRVLDPATGSIVVIVAGITPYGTVAAAELLTSAAHLDESLRALPADWATKNVEIVLETRIIDGAAGPPHVVASYSW